MRYGKNRGCDFLKTKKCSTKPEYCNSAYVSFYGTAFGRCDRPAIGCPMI